MEYLWISGFPRISHEIGYFFLCVISDDELQSCYSLLMRELLGEQISSTISLWGHPFIAPSPRNQSIPASPASIEVCDNLASHPLMHQSEYCIATNILSAIGQVNSPKARQKKVP
jgi:hypothetical protein